MQWFVALESSSSRAGKSDEEVGAWRILGSRRPRAVWDDNNPYRVVSGRNAASRPEGRLIDGPGQVCCAVLRD